MSIENLYSSKDYWADLAKNYGEIDSSGLAPILHPKTPPWFNRALDALQYRAFRRAVSIAGFSSGSRILDVGCGTGRWVRRYADLGFCPIGLDATIGMLCIARSHHTRAPLITGLASELPFSDSSFDGLSDITVVQHIPYELQHKALKEMVRVLRPGGYMILLELVRGQGSHIFPRPPHDWIREVQSCGADLIKCFGHEFGFPDRLLVHLAKTVYPRRGNHVDRVQFLPRDHSSQQRYVIPRVYWALRHAAVTTSAWIEPLLEKICSASIATHAFFVFRKKL
jgi:ubiquinone/menaquinone biosynthesis C-methylase UbiE